MDSFNRNSLSGQPVGKKKPFRLALKWFIPSFITAAVTQWTFLDPLDFHKSIFVEGSIWAWVYYWIVTLLAAGLVTSIRLHNYYRHIYHLYRWQSLVDNVYVDRTTLQGKYQSLISVAKKDFVIHGISLHTFLQNPSTREIIIESASNRGVNFRFLIHDPTCKFVIEKAKQEGKKENKISEDCEVHLDHLKEIRRKVQERGHSKGTIEIRTLKDKMPDCFALLTDETLYIEPYLQGFTGRDCPVFSMKRNEINLGIFDAYVNAMNIKWNNATVV